MSTLFFRFPRLAALALFLMIVAGIAALAVMGRQEDPYLTERFGRVVTLYPGADSERVEALISERVESALLELAEVDQTTSVSRANISSVSFGIREDLNETEVEQAWTKIREQVASIQAGLPAEASLPRVVREYMYAAVRDGEVDAITAYTTDGRISAFDLVILDDPAGILPPYDALVLVSPAATSRPAVAQALAPLLSAISADAMALRLAFMGTPEFAARSLGTIIAAGHDVVRVYTQPPRPAGRGQALRKSPVHGRVHP